MLKRINLNAFPFSPDHNDYLVLKAMAEAVKKIEKINRVDCRKHVEQNFSIQRMIGHYEEIFLKIIS